MDGYDLVFILTAIAFNLLIAGIFIAQKSDRTKLTRVLGTLWLALAIPLAVVFVHYVLVGRDVWILIRMGLVFLYMAVELLLDYILKVEFRQKPITHVPYIILEYIALFSLTTISMVIDQTWGTIVWVAFWVLLGSLVYLYWDKIVNRKK